MTNDIIPHIKPPVSFVRKHTGSIIFGNLDPAKEQTAFEIYRDLVSLNPLTYSQSYYIDKSNKRVYLD